MKVYIGGYRDWFGPYQLAEVLMFWVPKEKDEYGFERNADRVHNFGEWLAHGSIEPEPEVGTTYKWDRERHTTWIYKFLLWIDKLKHKVPREYIKIDRYDTWSMDHTLGKIILPMLKQLQATKHGSQIVDLEDVPEHLRATGHNDWDDQKSFDFYHETDDNKDINYDATHARWDWVLSEMIFAFERLNDDSWEDNFCSGEHDLQWTKLENGMSQMTRGPNDTYECNYEAIAEVHKRMDNGFRLFGKYYRGLWD